MTASPDRPNIVLILADQMRADALGCMGNPVSRTSNLDRLAREGALFTQAMVTQPTCTPSRASLLTGCFPSTLRSRMVGCTTPDDPRFIPRLFMQAGYRTASIGKIHLVPQSAEPDAIVQSRLPDGSTDYYGFQEINLVNGHGNRCFGPSYTPWVSSQIPDVDARLARRRRYHPGIQESYTYELPVEVHSSTYIGDQTVAFLKGTREDDRPFFLHVSFPDPHHPFTVPEPYASAFDPEAMPLPIAPVTESVGVPSLHLDAYFGRNLRMQGQRGNADRLIGTKPESYDRYCAADWQQVKALYYGMVSLVDDTVGRVLATLSETGLDDNTLIIFTSDHGDYLGDHGMYGKGLPYDGALRVPLIFRGVGVTPGRRIDTLASLLDVAPTILDVASIAEPEGGQGISLSRILAGTASPSRTAALTENDDDFVPMKMRVLTTSDWKLVYYLGEPTGELYDRRNDPEECVNLWLDAGYAHRKRVLLDMLLEEVMCSFDVVNGRWQSPAPSRAVKWIPGHSLLEKT